MQDQTLFGYTLPEASTLARMTDPDTSHAAARPSAFRATERLRLLAVFVAAEAEGRGLTDEEAGRRAWIKGYNHTRRCSELRRFGLIADTGDRRATESGRAAMVCMVTEAGRDAHAKATT